MYVCLHRDFGGLAGEACIVKVDKGLRFFLWFGEGRVRV